jgi:hypothetical protein
MMLVVFAQQESEVADSLTPTVQIDLSASKDTFLLGETVFLDFEIKNNSALDVKVRGLNLDSRYIALYVASDGKTYKKYNHSRISHGSGGVLKAGAVAKSRSGILWNFSPIETSTSNSLDALGKTEILTPFAFPSAGSYSLKAVLTIPDELRSFRIESEPIQITISRPVGIDLEVWNKIKDNGDIAYLIQENEIRIPNYKREERTKFKKFVEQIVFEYPIVLRTNPLRTTTSPSYT